MKIAVVEPIGIAMQEIRSELPGHTIIECDSRQWSDEQLIDFVKDADIIALTNRRLSAAVINSALRLQLIAVAFAGIDHIDRDAVSKRNIPVKMQRVMPTLRYLNWYLVS